MAPSSDFQLPDALPCALHDQRLKAVEAATSLLPKIAEDVSEVKLAVLGSEKLGISGFHGRLEVLERNYQKIINFILYFSITVSVISTTAVSVGWAYVTFFKK